MFFVLVLFTNFDVNSGYSARFNESFFIHCDCFFIRIQLSQAKLFATLIELDFETVGFFIQPSRANPKRAAIVSTTAEQ